MILSCISALPFKPKILDFILNLQCFLNLFLEFFIYIFLCEEKLMICFIRIPIEILFCGGGGKGRGGGFC